MCIYERRYKEAQLLRDESSEEIKRCNEAITYYLEWKGKIDNCIATLEAMIERTNGIASMCEKIILNGAPIDKGKRHYPNGNASSFASKLKSVKTILSQLLGSVSEVIGQLQTSLANAKSNKEKAINLIRSTPKPPCGKCSECSQGASTTVNNSETASQASTPPRKKTTHNQAVEVPL